MKSGQNPFIRTDAFYDHGRKRPSVNRKNRYVFAGGSGVRTHITLPYRQEREGVDGHAGTLRKGGIHPQRRRAESPVGSSVRGGVLGADRSARGGGPCHSGRRGRVHVEPAHAAPGRRTAGALSAPFGLGTRNPRRSRAKRGNVALHRPPVRHGLEHVPPSGRGAVAEPPRPAQTRGLPRGAVAGIAAAEPD